MIRSLPFSFATMLLAFLSLPGLALAQAEMKTQAWPFSKDGFGQLTQRIEAQAGRNLLVRPGVKVFGDADATLLVDGSPGEMGGPGRANISGQPSVIAFYLGAAKSIHEVGVFTCNGDSRANQDFEVRLADNSTNPGQMPKFPEKPTFTSGEKILGANSGGWHTSFAAKDGSAIAPKADWVEFRIWRTYPSKASDPAKTKTPGGWTAIVELEVLSDPKDAIVMSPEQKAKAAALRNIAGQPPYLKKATWQESMQASRELLLEWECEVDRLVMGNAGITVGPWQTVGALPAGSPQLQQIERLKAIDLSKPVALKEGQFPWRAMPDLADGKMLDLAGALKAKAGDIVVLARTFTLEKQYTGRDGLSVGIGASGARIRVVGGRSALQAPIEPAVPNQRSWQIGEGPGQYQLLALLPVSAEGKCDLWFTFQPPIGKPGAGNRQERVGRRQKLYDAVKRDFKDPASQAQIKWEQTDHIWTKFERRAMSGREWFPTDWAPGKPDVIVGQYNAFAQLRLEKLASDLPAIEPEIRAKVEPLLAKVRGAAAPTTLPEARQRYYTIATAQDAIAEHHKIASMRLAVKDQQQTFGSEYPKAGEFLARIDALEGQMNAAWDVIAAGKADGLAALLGVGEKIAADGQQILLANPLLGFEKLLLGRGGPGFASNWGGPNNIGNELVVLSPVKPDGQITAIHKGGHISDMDLSFDAKKILFSDKNRIHEVNVDGTGYRQITNHDDPHTKHYDACRLPNGKIMFVSTACEQAVPCTGEWYVGNLHLIDPDGKNERRLCFDQDHDWNPCVLNNGQVIYTRWEYTDTPHYFTRLLFSMNPDGSNQKEFYGSNSYWPNAMYWPRPIPGHPSKIVCVVSGHHGVGRVGEMVILDPAQGRHESSGVVQRIGDRGKKVEPVIEDGLVSEVWPRFAWPYPLAQPQTHRGAGKYFLVNCKLDEHAPWGVYLVDTFDNMTPLLVGNYAQPIPLRPRETPPIVPDRVDLKKKDATVYLVNVYKGPGLRGYPAGSVKALRIGSHEYRFGGNGDTYASSHEGGWDVKQILGTVPVEADGSAYFKVPANTPIFVQPLDADGKSLQVMRSWFTAMPGEVLSCIGCHEQQSDGPPANDTMAARRAPSELMPWYGSARGFGFDREVQPVLDRKCVGCHDGKAPKDPTARAPDFRSKQALGNHDGNYSPSYRALTPYVRRAGYEADYHMPAPAEFHASTSPLIHLLEKGHYNVTLSKEERDRLYTWIDFNVPYPANWRESHRVPQDEQVTRRAKYKLLYANVEDRSEDPLASPMSAKFEAPAPEAARPAPVKLEGWPLTSEQSAALQKGTGLREITLDLGDGVTMTLVPAPAGKFVMGDAASGFPDERAEAAISIGQAFFIGRIEVTNRQFAQFDPNHDSAYIDARGKDRFTRGYPANEPDQPVIRVTWHQAMAFCQWLSKKTGYTCTLPTEAQWEWACRAGSATPWSFGDGFSGRNNLANIADATISGWGWGRVDQNYNDSARFSIPGGKYPANAWGIADMHGNVAEWTRTEYRPYPYVDNDGRNDPGAAGARVVRGGSWNDTFRYSRSASRWKYLPHQPVYNVGFRIICLPRQVADGK